jgi:hypothetical protein
MKLLGPGYISVYYIIQNVSIYRNTMNNDQINPRIINGINPTRKLNNENSIKYKIF